MNKIAGFFLIGLLSVMTISCQSQKKESEEEEEENKYELGSFGYDLDFFKTYQKSLILKKGTSMVLLAPGYQGRVMTSSAKGMSGKSFGWINYDLISSGESAPHFNNYGGEERLWLGPEGGQFSVFFAPGVSYTFENWQVPAPIDSEAFELKEHNDTMAVFQRDFQLVNYSSFTFSIHVDRIVSILGAPELESLLNITLPEEIDFVGYQSVNTITNTGEIAWSKNTGLVSIWMLGQLISSPTNTVIVPYNEGEEQILGPVVNDNYFGKVPSERLTFKDGLIFFKADGKQRGKIGLSPLRSKNYCGSYDSAEKVLTVLFFNKPNHHEGYVNSMWELQEAPFGGDVINSYNDGPLEDGSQLGPFYELEASSPAALLKPGQSLSHTNSTIHFSGDDTELNTLLDALFGVSVEEVKQALGE